jgi:type IV secretory pathway VirB6-like protein
MNYFQNILCLLMLFSLSSCTSDMCIDAEDFGFESLEVSSRYNDDEILGEKDKQVAPWRTTSFTSNGRPIMIVVKDWKFKRYNGYRTSNNPQEISAWSPWYGSADDTVTLSKMNERLPLCQVQDNNMCTSTTYLKVTNPPCLFTKGIGLYALLATTDPNVNKSSMQLPTGLSFHLGDPHPEYNLYYLGDPAGGILFKYADTQETDQYASSKLYLKILDTHYKDNSGQYKVLIKSGVDYGEPGPISRVLERCKETLFGSDSTNRYGLVKTIYNGILNNTQYQRAVVSLLTLYIMFSGLSFLIGTVNMTHTELASRIFKIVFMTVMLNSTKSWSFFHDYLFVFFIEGIDDISGKFLGQIGSSSSGLTFFDSMLELMLGMKTLAKLASLLFTTWFGFIFIIVYLCLCLGYMFVMIKAVVLYLTCIIFIGLIITMAPIFFCFMLFDATKSLFDNWLKQLVSYTLQPIILIVGLSMAGVIIRHEIYTTLGFTVCKKPLFDMGDILAAADTLLGDGAIPSPTSFLYWWFPKRSPGDFCNNNSRYDTIPVPEDYVKPDGTYCAAYACNENRCIDMPFINLNDPFDVSKLNMIKGTGSITLLHSLIIFFLLMYLLQKYNNASETIAKAIAGTSMSSTTSASGVSTAFTNALGGAMSRVTSNIADKISMRMERAAYLTKNNLASRINRMRAGGNFFDDKKPRILFHLPRVVGDNVNKVSNVNKVFNVISKNYLVKKVLDIPMNIAKKSFDYAASSKIAQRISNINESFKKTISKIDQQLSKVRDSAKEIITKNVAYKASSVLLTKAKTGAAFVARKSVVGGYDLLTGNLNSATKGKYNVSSKLENIGLKKTARLLSYLGNRSVLGMSVDLISGVFKAARFLAVHRIHGLKYIGQKIGAEAFKDLKFIGKAAVSPMIYTKDAIAEKWRERRALSQADLHLRNPLNADTKLLKKAEQLTGVNAADLRKSQQELKEMKQELRKAGFNLKEVNKLMKGTADPALRERFDNINSSYKIQLKASQDLATEVREKNLKLKNTYASLLLAKKDQNKKLKLGESSELASKHFRDPAKIQSDDLRKAELRTGIQFGDLAKAENNIAQLNKQKTEIIENISQHLKSSGLNEKEQKALQKRIGSLEFDVNERLQAMKKDNPKLDVSKVKASVESELLKARVTDISRKKQISPEVMKLISQYDNISSKYQVERKVLDDNSRKLQKAYADELAAREVPTKKQSKAMKEEKAYLRGDAIQSKIEFLKFKLSGGRIGYEWHEADDQDKSARSYAEQQRDRQNALRLQEINANITAQTRAAEDERKKRSKKSYKNTDSRKTSSHTEAINSLMVEKRSIEFEMDMKDKFGSDTKIMNMPKQDRLEVLEKINDARKAMISQEFGNMRVEKEKEVKDFKAKIKKAAGIVVSEAKIREIYKLNLDERIPKSSTRYQHAYKHQLEEILGTKLDAKQVVAIQALSRNLEVAQNELKNIRKQETKLTQVSLDYMDRVEGKRALSKAIEISDVARKGAEEVVRAGKYLKVDIAAKYATEKVSKILPKFAKNLLGDVNRAGSKLVESVENISDSMKFSPERRLELEAVRDLKSLEIKGNQLEKLQDRNLQITKKDLDKIKKLEGDLDKFASEERKKLNVKLDDVSKHYEAEIKKIEDAQIERVKTNKDSEDLRKIDNEKISQLRVDQEKDMKGLKGEFEDHLSNKADKLGIAKAYENLDKSLTERGKKIGIIEQDMKVIEEKLSVKAEQMGYIAEGEVTDHTKLQMNIQKIDLSVQRAESSMEDVKRQMDVLEQQKNNRNEYLEQMKSEGVSEEIYEIEKRKTEARNADDDKKFEILKSDFEKLSSNVVDFKREQEKLINNMDLLNAGDSMSLIKTNNDPMTLLKGDGTDLINTKGNIDLVDPNLPERTGGDVEETNVEKAQKVAETIHNLKKDLSNIKKMKKASKDGDEDAKDLMKQKMLQEERDAKKDKMKKREKDKLLKQKKGSRVGQTPNNED